MLVQACRASSVRRAIFRAPIRSAWRGQAAGRVLTDKQETMSRPISFAGIATHRACLTRIIRIDFHRHPSLTGPLCRQGIFCNSAKAHLDAWRLARRSFRRYRYYLFTFAHVLASTRTFSNACEVLKADEAVCWCLSTIRFANDMIAYSASTVSLVRSGRHKLSRSGASAFSLEVVFVAGRSGRLSP